MKYTLSPHVSQSLPDGLLVFNPETDHVHFLPQRVAKVFQKAVEFNDFKDLKKHCKKMDRGELDEALLQLVQCELLRPSNVDEERRSFLKGGLATTVGLVISTALPTAAMSGPVVPTATCGANCSIAGCMAGETACLYDENDPAECTQSGVDGCCGIFGVTFSIVCSAGPCPPADGNNNFNSSVAC